MAFLQIISNNILPLIVFIAIGYILDIIFTLDVKTLNKLTFFVVLPSFIFYSVYSASINNDDKCLLFCLHRNVFLKYNWYSLRKTTQISARQNRSF